jgi:rhamnulokinase
MLMIPDVFHWLLSGEKSNEFTNATTTQLYNPVKQAWSQELCKVFDLPSRILGPVVPPGTVLGTVQRIVASETGLKNVKVVLPGTHDTASAVMSVPADVSKAAGAPDWCYISSGTWSLMGAELPEPNVDPKCEWLNFTNEGGVGGTTRFLKNIVGLWLVQECRRKWNASGVNYNFDQLIQKAESAKPLAHILDPDEPTLMAPEDMPSSIAAYLKRTGQSVPQDHGAFVRCALEALALKYRQVLGWLEELLGVSMKTIHIVGGGVNNKLLCQMAADCCQRTVIAGPVEATAIGNIMMQAVAAGAVANIHEARQIIRASFPVSVYEPSNDHSPWDAAYTKYLELTKRAAEKA